MSHYDLAMIGQRFAEAFDTAVQYCSSNIAAQRSKHNGIHFTNQYSSFSTKLSYPRQPLLAPEASELWLGELETRHWITSFYSPSRLGEVEAIFFGVGDAQTTIATAR